MLLRRQLSILILWISTFRETTTPPQIANPTVVGKLERLAKASGLSKTAAVENAVDRLLGDLADADDGAARAAALLAQIDRIPERSDAFDPLAWDERGLPA